MQSYNIISLQKERHPNNFFISLFILHFDTIKMSFISQYIYFLKRKDQQIFNKPRSFDVKNFALSLTVNEQ